MQFLDDIQRSICRRFGATFDPPQPRSRLGIALQTMGRVPIHGVRIPITPPACGWYVWAGDTWSAEPDFYQPLCVDHLETHCNGALPFLALPPGWRFLTDGKGYSEAWFDEDVLQGQPSSPKEPNRE